MADEEFAHNVPEAGYDDHDDYILPDDPPVEYCHTMTELEDEVNRFMIESCKVDACVGLYLSHLNQVLTEKKKSDFQKYCWGYDAVLKFVPEELQRAKAAELRQNLDRLVPGYLSDETSDILKEEKLQERFSERWNSMNRKPGEPNNGGSVSKSLVDTLVEKQYKERTEGTEYPEAPQKTIESCRQLRNLIEGERAAALFSCGGSIPITLDTGISRGKKVPDLVSSPVSVFWSKGDDSSARKVVLPLDMSTPQNNPDTLQALVAECDEASFGRGSQDVIDLQYRKAGKLNADQFATSFHPADFGILENIGQVLLPSISNEVDNQLQFRKVKAELYKMNVYSGPSGIFRKHVDTPRAENQIGSLVVCLPSKFTGGSLIVEHHEQKVRFDWSEKSGASIQWAAFYSDCEHEIETIMQGDRVTLTYNLYVTEPVGGVIPSPTSIVDPKTLPIYGWVKDLMAKGEFMKDGGVLGIFCSHAYAHSSKLAKTQLPRALKGADLVLYAVFKSLGIDVEVLPVLENDGCYVARDTDLCIEGRTTKRRRGYIGQHDWYASEVYTSYLKKGQGPLTPWFKEVLPNPTSPDEYGDIDRRWKLLMLARQVPGMKETIQRAEANRQPTNKASFYKTVGAHVGASRHAYTTTDRGGEMDFEDVVQKDWPAYYLPGITWITEPKHEEMAFSQIVYGNEPSIGTRYSCAAILAVIPPSDQR
ncbi:hypothetical protein BJX61DRAFT_533642 [Aspergillus egyptiacus]|nr:hypothetical protein BJX61DRAFT_533642 [Aspergillus egyptiacus]